MNKKTSTRGSMATTAAQERDAVLRELREVISLAPLDTRTSRSAPEEEVSPSRFSGEPGPSFEPFFGWV
jgi:hypothetical protein